MPIVVILVTEPISAAELEAETRAHVDQPCPHPFKVQCADVFTVPFPEGWA